MSHKHLSAEHMESVRQIVHDPTLVEYARQSLIDLRAAGIEIDDRRLLAASMAALLSIDEMVWVLAAWTYESKCPNEPPLHCPWVIPHAIGIILNVELCVPLVSHHQDLEWAHDYYIERWLDIGPTIAQMEKEMADHA